VAEKIGRQKKIGLRNQPCESHERQKNNSTKKIGLRNQSSNERKKIIRKKFDRDGLMRRINHDSLMRRRWSWRGLGWCGVSGY
jgi:hypothetical protein